MAIDGNGWTAIETKYPEFERDVVVYVPAEKDEYDEPGYFITHLKSITHSKLGEKAWWEGANPEITPTHWMYLEKPITEEKS